AKDQLMAEWKNVRYLILDECSMPSRFFFTKLSKHVTIAKTGGRAMKALAVLASAPLYYPIDTLRDATGDMIGRTPFEQFRTAVLLREQVRVRDPAWLDFLRHLRRGEVQSNHIDMLKTLVLTDKSCLPTNFGEKPWSEALLVTPRRSVRNLWNDAALQSHCLRTGARQCICLAEDTKEGSPLTMQERYAIATRRQSKWNDALQRNAAPDIITIAIGMKAMITANIETELDVANGARGGVVDAMLDEDEGTGEGTVVILNKLPRYVLVKMERTKA
ncbi:hypothetical protein BC834DRAFT_790249, partial [Gloeopeniophorella convolvens]